MQKKKKQEEKFQKPMRQGGMEFFSEKAHYERYQDIKIDVEVKMR